MCEANWLIGSPAFTHVGIARLSPPGAKRSRMSSATPHVAGRVRRSTAGRRRARRTASSRSASERSARYAPRFAASMIPRPPPPTTRYPRSVSDGRQVDDAPVVGVGREGARPAHDADHRPAGPHEEARQRDIDEVVVRALRQAFVHVGSAPAVRLDVRVDPPVERRRVVGAGVPALHQIVARVQALRAHVVGTLGGAQEVLESRVGAAIARATQSGRDDAASAETPAPRAGSPAQPKSGRQADATTTCLTSAM